MKYLALINLVKLLNKMRELENIGYAKMKSNTVGTSASDSLF